MSFTDMMSSGRGPGIIGMIIALVVLIGFSALFIFATDEDMQGAEQSMASIIANQETEIGSLKDRIQHDNKELDKAVSLETTAKQWTRVKQDNQLRQERISRLTQDLAATTDTIAANTKELASYKETYRACVYGKAKGRTLEQLQTRTGRVYAKVTIRDVTVFGVDIRHEEGSARIPPEELPEAMQKELQFDQQLKTAEIARHEAVLNQHAAAEAAAQAAQDQQLEAARKKNEDAARDQRIRQVAAKEARIDTLKRETKNLEQAILKEKFKALSKAPQMKVQLAADKREMDKLQQEVFRLRDKL